jgi:hypothetical protein
MGYFTFVMLGFTPHHITFSDPAYSPRPSCEHSVVHSSPKMNVDSRAYDTYKIQEAGYLATFFRVEGTV